MIKKVAFIFGVIFLLIGILGFIPGATTANADTRGWRTARRRARRKLVMGSDTAA